MTRSRSANSRSASSRQAEMRARPMNEFQSALYIDPRTIPKGLTYRWVREATLNQPDGNNMSKMLRAGWRPVEAKDHQDLMPPVIPGLTDHLDQNLVRMAGLLLMKRATKDVENDAKIAQMMNDQAVNGNDYAADQADGIPRFDDSVTMVEQVTTQNADFK